MRIVAWPLLSNLLYVFLPGTDRTGGTVDDTCRWIANWCMLLKSLPPKLLSTTPAPCHPVGVFPRVRSPRNDLLMETPLLYPHHCNLKILNAGRCRRGTRRDSCLLGQLAGETRLVFDGRFRQVAMGIQHFGIRLDHHQKPKL